MIKITIICLLSIELVLSSNTHRLGGLTQEYIDQFTSNLNNEFPGSVDMLYRWALEEEALDTLEQKFQYTSIDSHHGLQTSMALYILSKDPLMSEERLDGELRRIFGPQSIEKNMAKRLMRSSRAFTSVPVWYHSYWYNVQLNRIGFNEAMEGLYTLIATQKALGVIPPGDVRFSMTGGPAGALARTWKMFCLRDYNGTGAPPFVSALGSNTDLTMTIETRKKAYQFLAIRSFLSR